MMDYTLEYAEARRLMGLRTTNLAALAESVAFAYVRASEPHARRFRLLLDEIEQRRLCMDLNPPPWKR